MDVSRRKKMEKGDAENDQRDSDKIFSHSFPPSSLLQESAAKIRPVDLRMAIDARNGWVMTDAMAFGAQGSSLAADQKESIGRPVGYMTGATSFCFLGKMFIHPWPSFLRMAVKADLILHEDVRFPQTGPFAGSVRSMTIRAFQRPLYHLVGVGKVKIGLDILMAGEAESNLIFLQEAGASPWPVDLVAIRASHSTELMGTSSKLEKGLLLFMALETDIGSGGRVFLLEGND
jgi:hypothetical protein